MKHNHKVAVVFGKSKVKLVDCRILAISDANLAREADKASQGGYFLMLTEDKCSTASVRECCLFAWKSWRLRNVVTGTSSAEAQALVTAHNQANRAQMLIEFMYGVKLPIDLRCDHLGLVQNIVTCTNQLDDCRVAMRVSVIKDALRSGETRSLKHIDGLVNYADVLTKPPERAISMKLIWELMSGRVRNMF